MVTILKTDAVAAVRKNLDEEGLNESLMYNDENADNNSVDSIIEKTLPEAINEIHRIAPVSMLGGDAVRYYGPCSVDDEGVLSFTIDQKVLRLVAFQAVDSKIVVTEALPEDSPEARKQLNKYVRGTYDKPRLVMMQGVTSAPSFKYYSLKKVGHYPNKPRAAIKQLRIVEQLQHSGTVAGYRASSDLVDSILYKLTAMVLAIYGQTEAANYFNAKAITWQNNS